MAVTSKLIPVIDSKENDRDWSVLSGTKIVTNLGPGGWDSLSEMVFVASASCTLHNDKAKATGLSNDNWLIRDPSFDTCHFAAHL